MLRALPHLTPPERHRPNSAQTWPTSSTGRIRPSSQIGRLRANAVALRFPPEPLAKLSRASSKSPISGRTPPEGLQTECLANGSLFRCAPPRNASMQIRPAGNPGGLRHPKRAVYNISLQPLLQWNLTASMDRGGTRSGATSRTLLLRSWVGRAGCVGGWGEDSRSGRCVRRRGGHIGDSAQATTPRGRPSPTGAERKAALCALCFTPKPWRCNKTKHDENTCEQCELSHTARGRWPRGSPWPVRPTGPQPAWPMRHAWRMNGVAPMARAVIKAMAPRAHKAVWPM